MGRLKSFVAVTTAGLIGSILSVGVDAVLSASSSVSPWAGLVVTVIGIILVARDIVDIYEAGAVGLAAVPAFLFQFMSLDLVVLSWAALVVIAVFIEPIVNWVIGFVKRIG